MEVWLIQTGEPLPIEAGIKKMRTAILADKLVERGHSVLWWTSAFDHFKKNWNFKKDTEITLGERFRIFALKGTGYRKNVSPSRFIDHRRVAQKFKSFAPKMPKPNIIVVSTPPYDLAYEVVAFAKNNNIPVVVDIRDEWPDLFLSHVHHRAQRFLRLFLYRDFQMIKQVMRNADALLAMIGSLLQWGLQYAERPLSSYDRVFYLGSKRIFREGNTNKKLGFLENIGDKFTISFIGTFMKSNDPSIIIECAKRLIDRNIHFVLAGDGELLPILKKKASVLQNVSIPGWLQEEEISFLLRHSHVGVCPTFQIRNAFPNKAFTYFSAGLPVISAFQGDLKEIIEKHQIGFYYPPNDVDALVNCINNLYVDTELYRKMSENAHRVFDKMFDADKIYEEYAEHIEKIASIHGNKTG